MTKTTGSYESIIRGVSEQVAHQRYPGQHWAQDNMVSDPVRGLVRRWGSIMRDEMRTTDVDDAATAADMADFREISLYLGDIEYSFIHRRNPRTPGSSAGGVLVADKNNRKLLPVKLAEDDTELHDMLINGISSVCSAGRFVLMSSGTRPVEHTQEETWNVDKHGVAFIKVGNYSRTYTITVGHTDGLTYTVKYTTPASYYPGTLDTSDIPVGNDYVKQVNDRVYKYQTSVNQWIGTAAAAIVPAAIVVELRKLLVAPVKKEGDPDKDANGKDIVYGAGFPAADVSTVDNHICFSNLTQLTITDGADNNTVGAVFQEVEAVTDLSVRHLNGKVVKISPKLTAGGSGKAYYVKARVISDSESAYPKVIWEETAGMLVTPGFVAMLGTVQDGVFYMASSPARLTALSGVTTPEWVPSSSGDFVSQALPAMFGKTINYMRLFQDRLMLVAGSTVLLSKTGDYFNFFRASALQMANDDPIEMYALGSEDDIITDGALLDRDLLLFGNVWQYVISGREALLPQNPYMAIQSSYADSNHCSPVSAGNLVFYTQPRDHKLTVQQMQTGAYAGTVATFEVTQQLSRFLAGSPTALVATTSPSAVFVRTTGLDNGVYVFSYLDAPGQTERLFDSWSRWTWNDCLGPCAGITGKDGALLTITLRKGIDSCYYVLDEFTLAGTLSAEPYIDSQRPMLTAGQFADGTPLSDNLSTVLNASAGEYFLIGRKHSDTATLVEEFPQLTSSMVVGANYDSTVTVTNPYMRDRDGKPILDGQLTLSTFTVTLVDAAAVKAYVQDLQTLDLSETEVLNWVARKAGAWVLNTQQVLETATMSVGIYKETRNCKVRFNSRSWLPYGLSAIEWSGQFFTQRG